MTLSAALSFSLQSLSFFSQTNQRVFKKASWVSSSPFMVNFPYLSAKFSFTSSCAASFGNGFSIGLSKAIGSSPNSRNSNFSVYARAATEKTIHVYTDIDGKDVSLGKFKEKVLLIVYVTSKCGLTSSNYKEFSHLSEKYKTQGFEILTFPCNQFGGQEPGPNREIKQFACTRFKAEFPIFDKAILSFFSMWIDSEMFNGF